MKNQTCKFAMAIFMVLIDIIIASNAIAQVPQKMSYQAVIRNASNKLVVSQKVGMRVSIVLDSINGTTVYAETHTATTNSNGLLTLTIGDGTATSGIFSKIEWADGTFFIKTETDPNGGTDYSISGISQLLSVPFALHAKMADSIANLPVEKDPVFSAWDKKSGIKITENQISDLKHFSNADEKDPVFSGWDKKSGISITESQITDLKHFTNANEIDPRYIADSSLIKTGVRSWNKSLSKNIAKADTTRWGKAETDPLFSSWNKKSGISITESQITDLKHFTNANETDPKFAVDSSFIKTGTRSWNKSLAKTIDAADTTRWGIRLGKAETDPVFSAWNKKSGIIITESQISDLKHFTNANETDPKFAADSSLIKTGVRSWNKSLSKKITKADTTRWGKAETDPLFSAWDKKSGIKITESQITDLKHFTNANETDPRYAADSSLVKTGIRSWNKSLSKNITKTDTTRWGKAETDPLFSSWNKKTGISITESQITDLKHFTNANETDPKFAADSSLIKTGVRSWNKSLSKKITRADTTHWGKSETDPVFNGWDKRTGIYIYENQIINLKHFTTADEIDPKFAADSLFIKTGTRNWNKSLAKKITAADTTHWGKAETDPIFNGWDKRTGIYIYENQIINLKHFTTADEIDPKFAADSSFIKTGTRSWNKSLAKKITASDTTHWGKAETDPIFSAWDKKSGISITESQISDLKHFTTADEIDPKFAADSSLIKTGVRSWNKSLAKNIAQKDTTRWGKAETDPIFSAWDKKSGISITESQISDLKHFTIADEIDPKFAADSSFIKTGTRSWNKSLAKTIAVKDTTHWGKAETDPIFSAWDKKSGISITESQISDLHHFTNTDETDQKYAADSSFIKAGVRNWNNSPAKTITNTNITSWNNKSNFDGNYSSLTNAPNIANSIAAKTINLSSATNSSSLTINNVSSFPLLKVQGDGLVGINNVSSPRASLEVGGTEGILATGTINNGTIRALGAGLRFHWYPRKGAFRVGMAETSYWDDDGTSYPKLALYSYAMGYQPRATATASYALGAYCQATGDYALSLGSYSQATASHAVAIGTQAYATGIYSFAIGSGANTNGRDGSMVVGDDAYFQTAYASADNQLTMRFIGGYRLWTSSPDSTAGVYMRHNANGWSAYCDRNLKTNFEKLDFEEVLKKIDKIPVTKWNYKRIDSMKYIGPMAQDFYKAFQLGGTDSLGINSICMDGVNMAAIKGLIDRTNQLKTTVEELKQEKQKNEELMSLFKEQSDLVNAMRKELDDLKVQVSKYAIKSKVPKPEPQANNIPH